MLNPQPTELDAASLAGGRIKINRVYLKYLTSKTKPIKTQALFAPSRLRDREATFRSAGAAAQSQTCVVMCMRRTL